MSLEAVTTLLREVNESGAFAAQLAEDSAILTAYDLTPAERDALLAEDVEALRGMGVPDDLAQAVRGVGRPGRGYAAVMESEQERLRPKEGGADAEFLVPEEQDEQREESRPEEPGQTGSGPEPGPPAESRP